MHLRWIVAIGLLIVILVGSGCGAASGKASGQASGLNPDVSSIVSPYAFNFGSWEFGKFIDGLKHTTNSASGKEVSNSQSVVNYFSYIAQLNSLKTEMQILLSKKVQGDIDQNQARTRDVEAQISTLKPIVEQTIASQISQTLADQGIYNPLGDSWLKLTFPPVNFSLESPLYELIISPRDKIQRLKSVTIKPDITVSQMEEVESSVDRLDVSALVVQIGGLGATYPTFVVNNADLRWTVDTAAHEWTHQYLAFEPLGFRYVLDLLGIYQDYNIATINETVASIVGQEIGAMVYDKYYAQYQTGDAGKEGSPVEPGFDFNAAMRTIRKDVDAFLAQGQIDQAEKYMNQQQQYLASHGYYIRKLNQAYFAFYGTYATSPTSVDPTGPNLELVRKNSSSLKDFLSTVDKFSSILDLNGAVSNFK
jgi:hypothetical protein